MDAMIAKDFLTLSKRDYENGAVRDAIYTALKEREELIKNQPKVTAKFVADWLEKIKDYIVFNSIDGAISSLVEMLEKAGVKIVD